MRCERFYLTMEYNHKGLENKRDIRARGDRPSKRRIWNLVLFISFHQVVGQQEKYTRYRVLRMWDGKEGKKRLTSREQWSERQNYKRGSLSESLWKSIQHRRTRLIGHILSYESLVKMVLKGILEGNKTVLPIHTAQIMHYVNCERCINMKRKSQLLDCCKPSMNWLLWEEEIERVRAYSY